VEGSTGSVSPTPANGAGAVYGAVYGTEGSPDNYGHMTETTAVLFVVLCAGAGFVVAAVRRRNARKDLAARWERISQQREALRSQGFYLVQAVHVYQRARAGGSKAWVTWCDTGARQDTWFDDWYAPQGAFILMKGRGGYGPHNRNPQVLYVNQVADWVPAHAPQAWQKHQDNLRKGK